MRRALVLVLLALATPGPAAAYLDDEPRGRDAAAFWPSWLSERYTDGTIDLRFPRGWIENDTRTFGHVLSDNKSPTAAFVGIRYLPVRRYADAREFADAVARTLRPPRGRGTTILRTQAARLGGRRGFEAAIMWQVVPFSPLGPTMRVFGIELESGEVALLTLAAEKPGRHNVFFAWVKRSVRWSGAGS